MENPGLIFAVCKTAASTNWLNEKYPYNQRDRKPVMYNNEVNVRQRADLIQIANNKKKIEKTKLEIERLKAELNDPLAADDIARQRQIEAHNLSLRENEVKGIDTQNKLDEYNMRLRENEVNNISNRNKLDEYRLAEEERKKLIHSLQVKSQNQNYTMNQMRMDHERARFEADEGVLKWRRNKGKIIGSLIGGYAVYRMVNSIRNDVTRKALIEQLMTEDPILKQADKDKLLEYYATIHMFAPNISKDKNAVKELLTNFVRFGKVDIQTLESLSRTESNVRNLNRGIGFSPVGPLDLFSSVAESAL